MKTLDEGIKSIRFNTKVDHKLIHLSLKLGRTKKEIFAQMVDYFYRTKKDPMDLNDEMLKKEIASGISKIISFHRQQENDMLIPQFETLGMIQTSIDKLEEQSERTLRKLEHIALENGSISSSMERLHSGILDRKDLKMKFKKILDTYISSRDSLGWNPTSKGRDEIRKIALDSLFDL